MRSCGASPLGKDWRRRRVVRVPNRMWVVIRMSALMPQLDTTYGGDVAALIAVAAPVTSWLGWVVNLLVVEWWLHRRRGATRPGRSGRTADQHRAPDR